MRFGFTITVSFLIAVTLLITYWLFRRDAKLLNALRREAVDFVQAFEEVVGKESAIEPAKPGESHVADLGNRVGPIYLLLGVAQTAHSIEEMRTHLYDFFWTATGLVQHYLPAFPQFRMSAETFATLNMIFIAILLGTSRFVYAGKRWALFLAGIAAVIEVLNALAHLSGVVVFGGYVPGAASAPLLLILGLFLLRELRRAGALRT